MEEVKTKICSVCKQEKPLSEFCKHRRAKDGLNCACKDCARKRTEAYRERTRKKEKEKQAKREATRQAPGFVSLETQCQLHPNAPSSEALKEYSSEELMRELYNRGFEGVCLFPEFVRGVMLRALE